MPELMTLEEVAAYLRKTPSQMRWMIHQSKAPNSALIGGRRMFRRSEVEAFIKEAFGDLDE